LSPALNFDHPFFSLSFHEYSNWLLKKKKKKIAPKMKKKIQNRKKKYNHV